MKNVILVCILSLCTFACKVESKKVKSETPAVEIPVLAMGEFDTKAGDFVAKEVQIKGIVDHVCKHGGKKILLVTDEGDAHIVSDERFDENLKGSEILVNGIVLEDRIDEATCLKMEEDNIKSHSEGASDEAQFEAKKKHIQEYRDYMASNKVDHISKYSLKYVSHSAVN